MENLTKKKRKLASSGTSVIMTVEVNQNSVFSKGYPGIYIHAITLKLVAAIWYDNPTWECKLVPRVGSWEDTRVECLIVV